MISKTSGYAIQAVLHIAEHREDGPVRASEVSASLEVPANYLSKILHSLARAGLLTSGRGPRGGFQLARSPDDVSLLDIVGVFEPLDQARQCLLGRGLCSQLDHCPAHEEWRSVSRPVYDFLESHTIGDLLRERQAV